MFKKILWATDGSDTADRALVLAREITRDGDGELVVVHCVEMTLPSRGGGSFPVHADEDELRVKIAEQVAELSRDGVKATLEVGSAPVGGAAHAIAEAAGAQGAELIVVGTRGHTPLAGLLLGSVTQRLLHIAPCPVLAVPAKK